MAGDQLHDDPLGSPYATSTQEQLPPTHPGAWEGEATRQAIRRLVAGDTPRPDELGHHADRLEQIRAERETLQRLHDTTTFNLRSAVDDAVTSGMTESAAARHAGVTRQTIRNWIGK